MKKILFLFCVATAFVFEKTAIAQVTEIKIGSVTKSIVRETNNDMLLVYTEVSPTESCTDNIVNIFIQLFVVTWFFMAVIQQ